MEEKSVLGSLIDSDMQTFEEEISKCNRGVLITMKDTLSLCYKDLEVRVKVISNNSEISEEEKIEVYKGIFAELAKIEEKVVFLSKKIEELKIEDFDKKNSH